MPLIHTLPLPLTSPQVFQTMVKPRVAGSVSTVEAALCSLTELVMMGVAVMLTDVEARGEGRGRDWRG